MSAMASRPIIAVLDTTVVIAGLLWEEPPYSLLIRATERRDMILVTTPTLIAELSDTKDSPVNGTSAPVFRLMSDS